jgi:hypothetical protein
MLKVHNPAAGRFQVDHTQLGNVPASRGRIGVIAQVERVPAAISYLWVLWSSAPKPLAGWEAIARNGGSVLYRRADAR